MAEEQQGQSTLDVDTINEAIRRRHSQQTATLDVSDRVAQTQSPDRAAQVQALSAASGLPAQTVERNYDEIAQKFNALANDPARMREQLPTLTKYLSEPANASASKDDHAVLADIERLATFGGSIDAGRDQFQGSIYATLEATAELVGWNGMAAYARAGRRRNIQEAAQYGRQLTHHEAFQSAGDFYTYVKQLIGSQIPVFAAMTGGAAAGALAGEAIFPPGGGILGGLIGAALPAFTYGTQQVQQAIKDTGKEPRQGEVTQLTPEQETKFQQWVKQHNITDVDHPDSFYDYRGYWRDVAAKGQDQTQMQADGLHFPDTYKQHGHPTFSVESKYSMGPEDGGRWEGETYVPQELSAPGTALLGGAAVAIFDTILPARIGSKIVATFGKEAGEAILQKALTSIVKPRLVRAVVGEAARDMAIEGVTEAVQDAVTEVARAYGTDTNINWQDMAEQMTGSFVAGATLGGVTGGATATLESRHARRAAAQAKQQQRFFERLGQLSQASTTVQRAPAAAEAFIAEATKDGPVETVYAPLESWVTYWQSKGVDPALVAEHITGRQNALEDAIQTGEDLAIPTSRYAAYLAPTEHGAFFVNELRLRPDELNVREADELLQKEQARAVEVQPDTTEPIAENIAQQLQAADYGTPEQAKQYAALMSAGIRAIAEREGTNAQAIFDAYDIAVTRKELPDQQGAEPAPLLTPSATGAVQPAGGQEFAQSEHRIGVVIESYMNKYGDDWLGKLAADYNAGRLQNEEMTPFSSLQMRAIESGFTYSTTDQTSPSTGKVVSTRPELEQRVPLAEFDEQTLHDFVDRNAATLAEPGAHLGAWVDNGVVYLDISQVVGTSEEAEALARQHAQLAYYDLDSGESVYVNRPEDLQRLQAAAPPAEGQAQPRGAEGARGQPEAAGEQFFQSRTQKVEGLDRAPAERKDGALLVSVRLPTESKNTKAQSKLLVMGLAEFEALPDKLKQAATVIGSFKLLTKDEQRGTKTVEKQIRSQINAFKRNLKALYDMTPADWRERAMHWYVGANRIAQEFGAEFGFSTDAAAGALASLSPQMDWFRNVDLARRTMKLVREFATSNPVFEKTLFDQMEDRALESFDRQSDDKEKRAKLKKDLRVLRVEYQGKNWRELPIDGKARLLRITDESTASRAYNIVTPEGDIDGPSLTKQGEAARSAWGNYRDIGAAISILLDGSPENINEQLGDKHKVRSFYNNISHPWDARFVTIDTHAVAAAYFRALSQAAPEVNATMDGGNGSPESAPAGIYGVNGIVAQAYFELADELGILPRELQSVTWEAIRSLVRPEQKRGAKKAELEAQTDALFRRYYSGKITHEEYVNGFADIVGGQEPPAWVGAPVSEQGALAVATEHPRSAELSAGRGGEGADTGQPTRQGAREPGRVLRGNLGQQELARTYAQSGEPERLASIRIAPNRKVDIELYRGADPTSFVHETGHFFVELLGDAANRIAKIDPAARTEQQQQILADFQALMDFAPDEDHKGPGVSRKQHEQIAEAFTKYVLEGKAPSPELRGVFAKLRAFMLGIYSRLKLMNTPLTDEVREVFDRLLTSEQAVQEVESTGRVQPMFLTAQEAGMSDEEFALYRKQVANASRVARERTDQRMMQEIRRQQKRAWKAEESRVRDEVEVEYSQQPVYRALAAFKSGTNVDGTPLAGAEGKPLKMSKQLLQDIVGKDRVNRFRGLYTTEGGIDPTVAAQAFGFSSANEMLDAIEKAPPYDQEVADETKHRMLTKYGSVQIEGGAVEEAQRGYSSEDREKVVRAELAALHKLQRTVRPFERAAATQARQQVGAQVAALKGQVSAMREQTRRGAATIRAGIIPGRVINQQADIRLGKTLVRDLKPESFWQAGKVAAVEAIEAAARQEWDKAIDAKNRELLAIALYRGAEDRLDAIEVQGRKMVNLQAKPSQERLGLAGWGIREQVNDVLARYGFAPTPLNPVSVQPMDTWVQSLRNAGIQINDPPPELRQTTRRQAYKTLTVDEFMNVTEGVEELQHVARTVNKASANSKHATFKAERDALVQSIRSFGKSRPFKVEFNTKADKRWRSLAGAYAAHRKIADIARALDGFEDNGPMWNGVIRPINDAQNAKFERNEVEAANLRAIITKHYTPREEAQLNAASHAVFVKSIGTSMTKEGRLALALNWGNDTSRDRLLHDPARRWTGSQIQDILDTLDRRDWQFVEDVWRYLDTFWPEIAAQHKRETGLEPERVEGVPVQTKFGIIQGGYYPLAYDGRLSDRVGNMQAWSQLNFQANQSYLTGAVRRGFTQLRNEHVTLPVRLDLNVLNNHIEEVIHALTHHEKLTQVAKLLRDKEVSAAIRDRQGDQMFDIFKNALKDIALGGLPSGGKFDPALRWARSNTQMAGLALNLWTAAQQPSGIVNGIQRVGAGWVMRGAGRWLRDTATLESTVSWVSGKSPFMKHRHQTALQDRVELRKQLSRPDSWFDTAVRRVTNDKVTKQTLLDGMMWHIGIMQRVADIPTWLGQYEKSKHFGASEDEAVAAADQAVIDSQGSGLLKDLSELQRGSEFGKLWMTFYSYGNMTFNQAANATERAAQTIQTGQGFIGKAKKAPAAVIRMLGDYMLIYAVPAFLTVAIGHALGREDDKKSWWKEIVRETFSAAMNGVVGIRELALLLREGTRGYEGPAGARVVSSITNFGQQVKQGKIDKGLERAAISASGAVFGFPAAQMQRTVDGYEALKSGKAKSPLALIFGPARR